MSAEVDLSPRDVFIVQADKFGLTNEERASGFGILDWFSGIYENVPIRHYAVHQALLPATLTINGNLDERTSISTSFARALLLTLARCAPSSYSDWKYRARLGDFDIRIDDRRVRKLRLMSIGINPSDI